MGNCNSANGMSVVMPDGGDITSSFKIAVTGDLKSGKTSLIRRYTKNQFSDEYIQTKRATIDSAVKKVNVPQRNIVQVELWDIPADEDIDMDNVYFAELDAAIVVLDVSTSLDDNEAGKWRDKIMREVKASGGDEKLPVLLLGTKFDLFVKEKDETRTEEAPNGNLTLGIPQDQEMMNEAEAESGDIDGTVLLGDGKNGVSDETEALQPGCYYTLWEIVKKHGFLTGLLVSARDPDGHVHSAFQYLLRHLLHAHGKGQSDPTDGEQKGKASGPSEQKRKKRAENKTTTQYLHITKLEPFDACFRKCTDSLGQAYALKDKLGMATIHFQRACLESSVIKPGVPIPNYSSASGIRSCMTSLLKAIPRSEVKMEHENEDDCFPLISFSDSEPTSSTSVASTLSPALAVYNTQIRPIGNELDLKASGLQDTILEAMKRVHTLKAQPRRTLEAYAELKKPKEQSDPPLINGEKKTGVISSSSVIDLDEALNKVDDNCMGLEEAVRLLGNVIKENELVKTLIVQKEREIKPTASFGLSS